METILILILALMLAAVLFSLTVAIKHQDEMMTNYQELLKQKQLQIKELEDSNSELSQQLGSVQKAWDNLVQEARAKKE